MAKNFPTIRRTPPVMIFFRPSQYWSFLTLVDATLCGMVTMCAGCDVLEVWGAFVIGILAGILYSWAEHLMHHFHIDDPVGSVAVHLCGGILGVVSTPIFAGREEEYSWVFWKGCEVDCVSDIINSTCKYTISDAPSWSEGDCLHTPMYQLAWQLVGILAILTWTSVLSALAFYGCWKFNILRVDTDTEVRGIDIAKHGEPAYPTAAYGHGWDTEGQFSMNVMSDGLPNGTQRNVKALINPNRAENWTSGSADLGLEALAIAYREKYYRPPVHLFVNEDPLNDQEIKADKESPSVYASNL